MSRNPESPTMGELRTEQIRLFNELNPLLTLLTRIDPYKERFPGLYHRTQDKTIRLLVAFSANNELIEQRSKHHKQ